MAKSALLKPTQARPLVGVLFDPRSDVRIAAFGAVIRLPLTPSDWVQVGTYASWALGMSESTAERLAVIDAAPYVPLQSIRHLVARVARESRGEARSRALDAALKFPDPPTLFAAIREGGSGSEEAAQRLAAADLSQSLDEVRSLVRTVPRDGDVRFWLALALARFGVDHELKAVFEELQQGQHYRFASMYSGTLAELSASTGAWAGSYVTLRNTLGGLRLPALTRGWLSAIAATGEASQASSLATALLEAFDTSSSLDPPMARGDGVRFITPSPAARRRASREVPKLYVESSRMVVRDEPDDWYSLTLSERVMTPAMEGGLAPAVITALFRRAARAWDSDLGNHIVGWVQRHQANFRPDLEGLFREYWRLSVREVAQYSSSDNQTVGFLAGWGDESFYRWLCWQIAWTASRGGLRGLATGLAAHFRSSKPTERRAAALLIADAADYIAQPNGPTFGGGFGPTRRVVTQEVVEEVDRLIAVGEAGPARIDVVRGAFLYKVWYATTRAPVDPADPSRGFTNLDGGTVRFGTCTVQVPKTHQFGSTGTTLYRRVLRLRFSDDHLKIVERTAIDPTEFFTSLRGQLADLEEADRVLLVYLHGYNVSFDEAAIRAAQIGFDLKVPGATAFFSWPSVGSTRAYLADINRIAASETQIADFLTHASTATGARAVHIIAHSMGNVGLARAIQRITAKATARGGVQFGQIVLAAPDIDVPLFRDLAAIYPSISEHTTMYVSARDRALGLSRWLQRSDRAGYTPPVTVVPEIDTIEVTDLDLTMLGHAYYAEAAPILYDIDALLRYNQPPSQRLRLEPAGDPTAPYWKIRA
jgi:esterase/lipase superfamily enzyme